MTGDRQETDSQRLTCLWDGHARRVLAYAMRHADADAAQEVVSETFLVAWRRLPDVPADALPWLLVVARNTLSNQRRSRQRQGRLQHEMERLHELAGHAPGADDTVADRRDLLATLAALPPMQQEALLLVAWDGLSPTDAARVAGCSASAFHVRLFRARRHLQSHEGPLSPSTPRTGDHIVPKGSPA
jgi:RNA polymerase sigma factor (sigma-70 family)